MRMVLLMVFSAEVLSSVLFVVCVDDLLQCGIGCHWSCDFAGAIYYVDDLALLAPSPSAVRLK